MQRRRVLIVIPCFNEQPALPALVAELREVARALPYEVELAVVDDGSADETAAVARETGARVVRLCSNLGIGGAVQTGIRLAHEEGFFCAVQVDGDGQHPAHALGALLARLDQAPHPDVVVGSRFLEHSGFQSTALRRVGKNWLSIMLRLCVGLRTTDPTSGFRVFGPRALKLFSATFPYDFPEVEALALAHLAGLAVVEIPVEMRARSAGRSSIQGLLTAYYVIKVTVALLIDVVRGARRTPAAPALSEARWKMSSANIGSSRSSASGSRSPSSASSRANE